PQPSRAHARQPRMSPASESSSLVEKIGLVVLGALLGGVIGLVPFIYQQVTKAPGPTVVHVFVSPNGGPYIGGSLATTRVVRARCYRDFSAADPDRRSAHLCVRSSGDVFDPLFQVCGPELGDPEAAT